MTSVYFNPVLSVLYNLNRRHAKYYCYPSQAKLVELLRMFQNIRRSVRTLNRWLLKLEDEGFIKRRRRIKRDPVRGMLFKSTLYMITKKGYVLLSRSGVDCWSFMIKLFTKKKVSGPLDDLSSSAPVPAADRITTEEMREVWNRKRPG